MRNNLFQTNTFLMNNYFHKNPDKYPKSELLLQVKDGISQVNNKLDSIINRIHDELKTPIVMSPPFRWA